MSVPLTHQIRTARLLLRATRSDDAARALQIQSNWNVTKNLAMASFPADPQTISDWFVEHRNEWFAGTAYRFAITFAEQMIGVIDIDGISNATGSIGYWLDELYWGRGFAKEAAHAMVSFAFEELELDSLHAGHALDNLASEKVLKAVGFAHIEDVTISSRSRSTEITQRRYFLARPAHV
ncbi:MAG: GNAT family N-acetyltransferase [Candidatus Obscuribacterales bacterium]|nr:GNAT family N-acetyltransferase [Candidatus Obscuribacterales bacterium]